MRYTLNNPKIIKHFFTDIFIITGMLLVLPGWMYTFSAGDETRDCKVDLIHLDTIIAELGLPANQEADTQLICFVSEWIGTNYCYGGKSESGVDCSGFANMLYSTVYGQKLERVSTDIYHRSEKVKKKHLNQGDLVFFKTNGRSRVNHVGVYLWDGFFVHASTKRGVIISTLNEGYYEKTFVSGGRVAE